MKTNARAGATRNRVIGTVAAGRPIPLPDIVTRPIDYLDVSNTTRVPASGIFGLRVRGDSMIDARVYDGDMIVIKPQKTAKNGDLVVARLHCNPTNLETTIKRFFKSEDTVFLRPENPAYGLISLKASEVEIIGIVLAIWRNQARTKRKTMTY